MTIFGVFGYYLAMYGMQHDSCLHGDVSALCIIMKHHDINYATLTLNVFLVLSDRMPSEAMTYIQ